MKSTYPSSLFIILSLLPPFFAQTPPMESPRIRLENERNNQVIQADLEERMRQMRNLESRSKVREPGPRFYRRDAAWERYIRELRRVPQSDIAKYSDFLKEKKTGIFRLFPNHDCESRQVIKLDGNCSAFVPGTSDYSFRIKDYSGLVLHDLRYNRGQFMSDSFFSHGILVSLGNVPIEALNSTYEGFRFLVEFQPAIDPTSARRTSELISEGIKVGDYTYSTRADAAENTTYALRQIAYRLKSLPLRFDPQTVEQRHFLWLSSDERDDITVVFRIVKKDAEGVLTILWKELARLDAPKIKFGKGEVLSDFKPISR